jgi:hypothetical protein
LIGFYRLLIFVAKILSLMRLLHLNLTSLVALIRMDMNKKKGLLIGLNGLLATCFSSLLVVFLGNQFAIDSWEKSLGELLFYILLVTSVLALSRFKKSGIKSQVLLLFAIILVAFGVSFFTHFGLLTVVSVSLSTFVAAKVLSKLNGVSFYVSHSILNTALLGSLWVVSTAPIYAEGFVLLTWIILASHNFIIAIIFFVSEKLINFSNQTCSNSVKIKTTLLVAGAAVIFSGGLSFSALYHMISVEAEPTILLKRDDSWHQAFRPFGQNVSQLEQVNEPSLFSKQQFVDLLLTQSSPSISQIATLYFLTGDQTWVHSFKQQLLKEAKQDKYTGNTGSVKFSQREVMIRALYLLEIKKRLPDYFSPTENIELAHWFEKVTAKILSPEWVDFLYAVPFRDDPDGPYLNQEIGAGALAVLQHVINDQALKNRITTFLTDKASGFLKNYRNPDDSMEYHDVWVQNAFVMHLYAADKTGSLDGMELAIQWLISQLPQNTMPLEYGLPHNHRPVNSLAIAAFFLNDAKAKWLLEQHLLKVAEQDERLESSLMAFWLWNDNLLPQKPVLSSIVLDGPTGYAFRPGPLAPDKVVMRRHDEDSFKETNYLIANLRNIGWHRYPATNTATRIMFDDTSIAGEDIIKKKHLWLPSGRATHRDKKIDRIRLNGLQIARDGLDAWLGNISGVYSSWRQDVPRSAQVVATASNKVMQSVTVMLKNWQGTDHYRTYLMLGPHQLFVIDEILSQRPRLPKVISWHFRQDFEPISAHIMQNDKYTVAFSDPITYKRKTHIEESAYSEFVSNNLVTMNLTKMAHKVVVTAFSSKVSSITDILIKSPNSDALRFEINYSLSGEPKTLKMKNDFKWHMDIN